MVSLDEIHEGVISGAWTAAETQMQFTGWTCDATRYGKVTQGYLTQSALDTTKHRFVDSSATTAGVCHFHAWGNFQKFVFQGLQAVYTGSASSRGAFGSSGIGNLDVVLSGCIGIIDGVTADAIYCGLFLTGTIRAINCFSYHKNIGAFWARAFGWVDAGEYNPTVNSCLYYCTAYGFGDDSEAGGFYVHAANDDMYAKNCVSQANLGDDYKDGGAGRWNAASRNCLSGDATVPDAGTGHLASKTLTFEDAENFDLRLNSGDTDALEAGVDLVADGEFSDHPELLDVDFFGNDRTWTETPDLGAHQLTTEALVSGRSTTGITVGIGI